MKQFVDFVSGSTQSTITFIIMCSVNIMAECTTDKYPAVCFSLTNNLIQCFYCLDTFLFTDMNSLY